MKLLPPADLLQSISGIEQGLRKNRVSGLVGAVGALLSAAQVASGMDEATWAKGVDLEVLGLGALVLSVLLILRSRLWLKESSEPFRYTCTLQGFKGLGEVAEQGFSEMPVWMKFDLSERLDERIRRLSFLEAMNGKSPLPPGADSGKEKPERDARSRSQHIEITGDFVVRRKTERGAPGPEAAGRREASDVEVTWLIEVTPWVRVGAEGAPATLAHSLPYECPVRTGDDAIQTSAQDATSISKTTRHPELSIVDYNAIIERVYFSLATHIYRQIREDVQGKIDLLPTRYLKATAYFHEAEDYAASNTLDGLEAAIDLYRRAMELFDPKYSPVPKQRSRRLWLRLSQMRTDMATALRLWATGHRAAVGRRLVIAARAEVGFANSLLYRRTLAGMSGRRKNPIYEARHVAERGIKRLKKVSARAPDAPGVQQALFDANVCLALCSYEIDWFRKARKYLQDARSVLPASYDQHARYLYVAGLLEPRASALRFLRQAVERDERFEVAQFELALRFEMLWRSRPTLERSVGELIAQEYERVLVINPSNVAALGHIGYLYWLLDDDRSAAYYRRGLEYKHIRHDIVTADLDIGLARIAAEHGRIKDVYRHYVDASSALLLQGVSDWKCTSAQFYFFDFIGNVMLERYRRYRKQAVSSMTKTRAKAEQRMNEIALSFVENDYGEACFTYHLRNRSPECLDSAEEHFRDAKRLNEDAVLPRYNLYLLLLHKGQFGAATRELDALVKNEPNWADAKVAEMAAHAEGASREWSRRVELPMNGRSEDLATSIRRKAERVTAHSDELRALVPHPWLWDGEGGPFLWEALDPNQDPLALDHVRQFGDLHVHALFEWTLANLALERLGHDGPGSGDAAKLLAWIRKCCWPADFRVLFACHQIDSDDEDAKEDLREAVQRWLTDDAAAYWALDLAVRKFYDLPKSAKRPTSEETAIVLFTTDERLRFLDAASTEAEKADNKRLIQWVDDERRKVCAADPAGRPTPGHATVRAPA